MWQVISRAAHNLHLDLAGVRCPYGQQRKSAKHMHRDEYGPGKHREGLPETLSMRQPARTVKHLANLVGLLGKGHSTSHPAVAQLRTALLRHAELCPTVAASCRLAAHSCPFGTGRSAQSYALGGTRCDDPAARCPAGQVARLAG